MENPVAAFSSIPAGETKEFSYTYTVTEEDIKDGTIVDAVAAVIGTYAEEPLILESSVSIEAKESEPVTTEPVQTEPQKEPIASDEKLCTMAVNDYQLKNNTENLKAVSEKDANENLVITILDDEENVVDTYTIDPATGKGTSASGDAVDLPQTGNNSLTDFLIAAAAFLMLGFGSAALMYIRKKCDTEPKTKSES